MPEGPELRMNSRFINKVCSGLVFGGRPVRSPVSKSAEVSWDSPRYSITGECRGKEMALILQCLQDKSLKTRILFRFGMSGKFTFTPAAAIPKHAHLRFHTLCKKSGESEGKGKIKKEEEEEENILSFVDTRRFGSWHMMESGWGKDRGPDIVDEYEAFRSNVLDNLEDPVFGRAVCEVMLNQKYFNGVGNYLRAEVLFRAKIPPFTRARDVLQLHLDRSSTAEGGNPDMLALCRDVSQQVIALKQGSGKDEVMTMSVSESDHEVFMKWLRCYNNPAMSIIKDKNGRTVWFQGEVGPLAPKGGKMKAGKRIRAPDNPNPSAISTKTIKEEPEESPGPAKIAKVELDIPIRRVKSEKKVTTATEIQETQQVKKGPRKIKKAKMSKATTSKITKSSTSRTLKKNCDIPTELLRRSVRLKKAPI